MVPAIFLPLPQKLISPRLKGKAQYHPLSLLQNICSLLTPREQYYMTLCSYDLYRNITPIMYEKLKITKDYTTSIFCGLNYDENTQRMVQSDNITQKSVFPQVPMVKMIPKLLRKFTLTFGNSSQTKTFYTKTELLNMVQTLIIDDPESLNNLAHYLKPECSETTHLCNRNGCLLNNSKNRIFKNIQNISFTEDVLKYLYWIQYDSNQHGETVFDILNTLGCMLNPKHLCVVSPGPYHPYMENIGTISPYIMESCLSQWQLNSISSHGFLFNIPQTICRTIEKITAYLPTHIYPCKESGQYLCQNRCQYLVMEETLLSIFDLNHLGIDKNLEKCHVVLVGASNMSLLRCPDEMIVLYMLQHSRLKPLAEILKRNIKGTRRAFSKFQMIKRDESDYCVCCGER
ncbi:uncharacterized protein I206_102132 [Kwoniella pini CBS 10737]|uniref:Uncharacterized protein n=1 Tax=Kwoniella pini CBS 10737 TaxID=1296096 RepID=A0A1B9HUQ4_9TREE|nr:uncharacterized protein I206_06775 [Kwoniella pini CBS 10737]OCF47001.1 hypothetical protein I206_06775 [Kwoniella pini CBS 10737]